MDEFVPLPPPLIGLFAFCEEMAEYGRRSTEGMIRETVQEIVRRRESVRIKAVSHIVQYETVRYWIARDNVWSYISWEYDKTGRLRKYRRVSPNQVRWYHPLTELQKKRLRKACKKMGLPLWQAYYYRLKLPWIQEVIGATRS